MAGICPEAIVIEISHQITRHSVAEGARTLAFALPSFPIGTHVAVVDPGVGTNRIALAIQTTRGDVLIGPDNGLLLLPGEALGGIDEARAIENRKLMLPDISSTFHGRDVFSPVAAYLASGVPIERVGPLLSAATLVRLREPQPTMLKGEFRTEVTYVSVFGNVMLAGGASQLEAALGPLAVGQPLVMEFSRGGQDSAIREETTWRRTFAEVPAGASLLFIESEGQLSFADNRGDAARRLQLAIGQIVCIRAP
jgi:S-adenosylmethionine hydrolase